MVSVCCARRAERVGSAYWRVLGTAFGAGVLRVWARAGHGSGVGGLRVRARAGHSLCGLFADAGVCCARLAGAGCLRVRARAGPSRTAALFSPPPLHDLIPSPTAVSYTGAPYGAGGLRVLARAGHGFWSGRFLGTGVCWVRHAVRMVCGRVMRMTCFIVQRRHQQVYIAR